MKKVPGLSTELPPKRSFITGQPIAYPGGFLFPDTVSPFAEKTVVPDVVLDELARLNHGFTKPGRNLTPRLELSPKQYDRFLELHGTIKLGGKTLKDRLQHEMEKDTYDIDRSRVPDGVGDFDDHRVTIVGRIISGSSPSWGGSSLVTERRQRISCYGRTGNCSPHSAKTSAWSAKSRAGVTPVSRRSKANNNNNRWGVGPTQPPPKPSLWPR